MSKYLNIINGIIRQIEAITSSAGASDAGKMVALDSTGRLDVSFMPVGIGPETHNATAGEALSAGNLVYITNTGTVMKADASASNASKAAVGFVLSAVPNNSTASVYTDGYITGLTGLTAGARYYLSSSTPGEITSTPPSGSGHCVQFVGTALSSSVLQFHPVAPVVLA